MRLFFSFDSQEEHRDFGGSAFIEFQFCKLPVDTRIKKIIAIESITQWQDDSLYVSDLNIFSQQYSRFFDCGIYNNQKNGMVDIFGINYYAPSFINRIIENLNIEKPTEYQMLVSWLYDAKKYNGFYILGV